MSMKLSRVDFLRLVTGGAGLVVLSPMVPAMAEEKRPITVSLADAPIGSLPPGFTAALTGGGGPVAWMVQADEGAPQSRMLAQTSTDRTDDRFPLCIYDRVNARDVDVSVRFKPVAGRVDRAGGIIVRVTDPNNYYVVRANALEDNVRLYRVARGRRTQFAGVDAKVRSGEWQSLRLRVEGQRFTVFFEGKELYGASDSTFAGPGRIGLWTKADSVTYFDQLTYTELRT